MAFKYLQVNSLHCVVDLETHRVVDQYTDELAAHKEVRALNGEDEGSDVDVPSKGEMPSGTKVLTADDMAAAGRKARNSINLEPKKD